jgi:hypothetical protein
MVFAVTRGDWWVVPCGFGAIAAVLFVSAFFPKWGIKWGGPHSPGTVPMSVRSRVAFGIPLAWAAVWAFIMLTYPSRLFEYLGVAIYVLMLIGAGREYYRDKRFYEDSIKLPIELDK